MDTNAIVQILNDNAVVIGSTVAVLVAISFVATKKKHPLEPPYVHRGIPVLGNFIEFAKGEHFQL
jgi:hypothetical protein